MGLSNLGFSAHPVFDMTTPPRGGDLLIVFADRGVFSIVDAHCTVACSNGGRVLLLTAQPETGSCVKHANAVAYVAMQTTDDDADAAGNVKSRPLLPMGSVYEAALFVLFEMMIVYKLGESQEAVRSHHTNLG
ncbi:hxlB, partial [Mucuna pruriens]